MNGVLAAGSTEGGSEVHPGNRGAAMHALTTELFPICRSITGEGLRTTLRRIAQEIPIHLHEVRTGTRVLDWVIPREWNIREAWIANGRGERIVDFQNSNLHVVNYSPPVHARFDLRSLKPKLHSLPNHPDWIPYRTSYYREEWGFCVAHRVLEQMPEDTYEVRIDSSLTEGALTYGELLLPGESEEEFLISAHCCHPSLANDNLSGIAVAVALAQHLQGRAHRLSYRFLFAPGTIGAITWLAHNEATARQIKHGLVLTCLGDASEMTYKRSRRGAAVIDRAMEQALSAGERRPRILDFSPYGYDERQYGSPGFNLPVGCVMRSLHGSFPEYHTSADNLNFIAPAHLADSFERILKAIELIEANAVTDGGNSQNTARSTGQIPERRCLNLKPKGEPQLGRYGVYEAFPEGILPALWVMNLSDGEHSLAEIALRAALPFDKVAHAADILITRGLLKEVEP